MRKIFIRFFKLLILKLSDRRQHTRSPEKLERAGADAVALHHRRGKRTHLRPQTSSDFVDGILTGAELENLEEIC